jgi:hypothetical protein
VLQTYGDGGDLTSNSPYADTAALVAEMNSLSGCPVKFAVPTAQELSESSTFISYAIQIVDDVIPASQVVEISEFNIDGEEVESDITSITPCITGFDRISDILESFKLQNGLNLASIEGELQNIRFRTEDLVEQTEFDTEGINWQPLCVDGVQWYFADNATFEFGSPSVDDIETIYKQGDDGGITTVRPTGTTITQGYCPVSSPTNVSSAPSFSGITIDTSTPDSSVGGGFFTGINIVGTITITLTSGKVLTYTTDGSTARVTTLQDFSDVFNTHVSAFTSTVFNNDTLVLEEATISSAAIQEIEISNDDGSQVSTYTTFSLAAPSFDNFDLIRRILANAKNELEITNRDYAVLRNVATTVTTSVIDFSNVGVFGNLDDAVGAIITVKNGTLYSVIQPGAATNNPVTLGVPVSSGATVHIGKTPVYPLQDEVEIEKWRGATLSGTSDIIVQFYKYKI